MSDPTFAQQMVSKYQALLLANAGAQSISIDGQSLSLTDLEDKLAYWERKVAIQSGRRPRSFQIYLGNP
ncbi:hypothetical protein BH11PLA2_BH11PLA2_34520 [soil metagenome]